MDALAHRQFRELERDHWWFRGRRRVYLGLLRHHLGGTRPRRILDVGAGAGGFLPGLAELGEEVAAVDLDPAAASRCHRRGPGAGLAADGQRLPFRDGSFDLVCLFDVLEHLDDDRAALGEAARVLRPGGLCFLSVPAHPFLYAANDRISGHRRRYTRDRVRQRIAECGLQLERCTGSNCLLFPLIAPAVLAARVVEAAARGLGREAGYTNLSWPLPRPGHALLYRAFAAELPLARRFDLPLGHSIAAIARRPGAPSH